MFVTSTMTRLFHRAHTIIFFFLKDTPTPEIYPLPHHAALPIPENRPADHAAGGGQARAQRKDGLRQYRHVDAHALGHLAVVDGGADARPGPRLVERQPQ